MWMATLLAAEFLKLTGPDHQPIDVNPHAIVDFRPPRQTDHFAPGTKCLVFMSDAKFLSVIDSCASIKERLHGMNGHE